MTANETTLLTRRRIERHRREAEAAKREGERQRFWQERRAMLLAQAELWELRRADG